MARCRPTAHRGRHPLRVLALSAIAILLAGAAFASDPPDATVNAVSGQIETVDCVSQAGLLRIRHSMKLTQGWVRSTLTLGAAQDDTSPRVASSPGGGTYIAFVRNTAPSRVMLITRPDPRSDWNVERLLSDPGEVSRNARIVHDGSQAHIAFEVDDGNGGVRVAALEGDDPSGYPSHTIVGTSSYCGDHDLTLVSESGHTWLSWVDVGSNVAWVSFDPETKTWSLTKFESYAADSVANARDRIRKQVLSN